MPRIASLLRGRPAPPGFIGAGAETPGSDWWYAALRAHPRVRGPRGGDGARHFFDAFCMRELQPEDIARYHAHFAGRGGAVRGEWSGRYLADGWVAPLLRRVAPDARILVMLEDPIERYRVVWAERMATRVEGKRLLMTDVAARAAHAFQLDRLRRYFPAEQVLVLQYERCRADTEAEYRRTLRFLGVPERMPKRLPPPPESRPTAPLWPEVEAALHASLDDDVEALARTVPGFDLSLWPSFRHLGGEPARSVARVGDHT